jgi:hypothetical protein
MHRILLSLVLGAAIAPLAGATPIIDVGNHLLLPNLPGQTILIYVTGGDAVEGLNLNVQVADGGSELAMFGGSIDGPAISDLDIVTGTIFDGNNQGADDPEGLLGGDFSQIELRTILTDSGTVAADGLLVTLTIDTTDYFSGQFDLRLFDTLNGPSDFAGIAASITDGTITIVPEPGTLALACCAVCAALARIVCQGRK